MIPALIVGTVAVLAACAWAGWAALGPWLIALIGQLDERPRPPRPQDHPCAWTGCGHSGWILVHHVHGYDARVCADRHVMGQRFGTWSA